MSSFRCPQCNLVNWTTAINCKRCGILFQSHESNQEPPPFVHNQLPASMDSDPANIPQTVVPSTETFQTSGASDISPAGDQTREQSTGGQNVQTDQQPENYYPSYSRPHRRKNKQLPKMKMAVFSMVCGIAGLPFFSLTFGGIVCAILAVMFGLTGAVLGAVVVFSFIPAALITGIIALKRAVKFPQEYGGKGFAITGLACGGVSLLILPVIAAIAIPNFMAARRAANESSAILILKDLAEAEAAFVSSMNGRCADLEMLVATKYIDPSLSKSEKNGYLFMVISLPDAGCEIHAVPKSASDGNRSFFYSTEDKIYRWANKKGKPADRFDRPLTNEDFGLPPQVATYKNSP